MSETLLRVKNLKKYFPIEKGFIKHTVGHVMAVNDISFEVGSEKTVSLVGESGCGKSTTGNCIVRLLDATEGSIEFLADSGEYVDLVKLSPKQLKKYRSQIQMVFQDPYSSLNPRMSVFDILSEPMKIFGLDKGKALEDRVAQLMKKVGLQPDYMRRFPHAFSGGQRQRIGIARALALNPKFLVCDEAVSALDVSVQAQILGLLEDLQDEFNVSYLFIAHDLSVVKHISDEVVVMYVGKIFEIADTDELFHNPRHPYTEALLSSVPKMEAKKGVTSELLAGEVPDPSNPPPGCFFHPRCKYAIEDCKICSQELLHVGGGGNTAHVTSCIRHDEIQLKGI